MHKWQAEGVDPDKPGPHWANKYDGRTIGSAADFMEQYMHRVNLRAFWPMEWRLVVEWTDGLRRAGWELEAHGTHAELWGMYPPHSVELNPSGGVRILAGDADTE